MKVNIQEKKENLFLKRMEVKGMIEADKVTPSNTQLAEALAKELGKEASLVIVRKIHNHFGSKNADFLAVAYATEEAKNKAEPKKKEKKAAPGEQKKE